MCVNSELACDCAFKEQHRAELRVSQLLLLSGLLQILCRVRFYLVLRVLYQVGQAYRDPIILADGVVGALLPLASWPWPSFAESCGAFSDKLTPEEDAQLQAFWRVRAVFH